MMLGRSIVRPPPSSSQYSILHGVGTVANALSVGDRAKTFDRFAVDVAAFQQSDEEFAPPEQHRSARMIWNEIDVRSPRLEIHVQTKMLRHLVELYVTKRIDTVIMSMKIAIVRQIIVDADPESELLPSLTRTVAYTSDVLSASSCRCRLPWSGTVPGGSRKGPLVISPPAPRPASCQVRSRAFMEPIARPVRERRSRLLAKREDARSAERLFRHDQRDLVRKPERNQPRGDARPPSLNTRVIPRAASARRAWSRSTRPPASRPTRSIATPRSARRRAASSGASGPAMRRVGTSRAVAARRERTGRRKWVSITTRNGLRSTPGRRTVSAGSSASAVRRRP